MRASFHEENILKFVSNSSLLGEECFCKEREAEDLTLYNDRQYDEAMLEVTAGEKQEWLSNDE